MIAITESKWAKQVSKCEDLDKRGYVQHAKSHNTWNEWAWVLFLVWLNILLQDANTVASIINHKSLVFLDLINAKIYVSFYHPTCYMKHICMDNINRIRGWYVHV